jgi:hypothetical protein
MLEDREYEESRIVMKNAWQSGALTAESTFEPATVAHFSASF